jgi:hypothetical protein
VRQAIGMLGHRVDASSIARRGSRFSIFAAASREKGRRSVSRQGHPRNGKFGAPP